MTLLIEARPRIGDGRIVDFRIALAGVGETPLRVAAAESLVKGGTDLPDTLIEQVSDAVRSCIRPKSDVHASADFRRHLAYAMTRRCLRRLWRKVSIG